MPNNAVMAQLGPPHGRNFAGAFTYMEWTFPGQGSTLSVTLSGQRVVYAENYDTAQAGAVRAANGGLVFGRTTRRDFLRIAGNDGFYYTNRGESQVVEGYRVWFHSYALRNQPGTVATFVFKAVAGQGNPAAAVLDAVILGDVPYLNSIWGTGHQARPGYQPIEMQF